MFNPKTILGAALALPTLISAFSPVFCTDAIYPEGPFGQPLGSGFCAVPSVDLGVCYALASFPESETGPLIDNLTFIEMPNPYRCNLYMDDACEGDFFTAEAGQTDLGNPDDNPNTPGVSPYDDNVASFLCEL